MYLKWILYPKKSWVPSFGSSVTLDPAGANRFGWEIRVNWQNTTGKKQQQQKQQETNTDSIQKKKHPTYSSYKYGLWFPEKGQWLGIIHSSLDIMFGDFVVVAKVSTDSTRHQTWQW